MATDPGSRQTPALLRITSTEAGIASSPSELLRRKLLSDKDLLDYIPLNEVELLENGLLGGNTGDKINLAQMKAGSDASQPITIWASWSIMASIDELPDIDLSAYTSAFNMVRYQFASLGNNASFRAEFMPVKHDIDVLKAILKCCFLMKQTCVPFEIKLSASFLDLVRKGCHMYKTSASDITTLNVQVLRMPLPRAEQHVPLRPSISLKTPIEQFKKERPANEVATPATNTPSSRRKRASVGASSVFTSGSRRKRLKGSFFPESSEGAAQQPQARDCRRVTVPTHSSQHCAAISTQPHPSSASTSPALKALTEGLTVSNNASASSQQHITVPATRSSKSGSTSQPAFELTTTNSNLSPPEGQATTIAKSKDELEQYLALHEAQTKLADTLRTINRDIADASQEKRIAAVEDSRLKSLAQLLVEQQAARKALLAKHERELQALTTRHEEEDRISLMTEKAEIMKINEAHASHQAKLAEEEMVLQEHRKVKLQEKNAVAQELERKRQGYTDEQLRLMFDESAKRLVKERMKTHIMEERRDRKKD